MARLSCILALSILTLSAGGSAPQTPDLEKLAWMTGSWRSERGGTSREEWWTAPRGGLMLGLHRDVRPSGDAFFEYLRIEETEDGLVYVASPGGRPPTPFPLVNLEPGKAVFSNPKHDYPQRILYWLEDDELHARIEGDTPMGTESSEWAYRKVPEQEGE
jgi:hypothetical protein